jgi:hypothetical protein
MALWGESFFLKRLTRRRAIGIREIGALHQKKKIALLHRINPALRPKRAAMTVTPG